MIYSDYVTAIANLMVLAETITDPTSATPSTDPNFNSILPRGIEYAEQRMYQELDLLQNVTTATTLTTANNRAITIPGALVVLNSLNVITPAGAVPDASGSTRNPVTRTTTEALAFIWPQGTAVDAVTPSIPRWFANKDNTTVFLAPAPDGGYTLEFSGIFRPAALSASNISTILTTYIPQVFIACSMVFFSGYQRDYGAQSDDPKLAMSWETQYAELKKAAVDEIARMKAQAPQWQPFSPTTQATPPRQ